ncbi:unnamed protein product [Lampetra fluviatilis]
MALAAAANGGGVAAGGIVAALQAAGKEAGPRLGGPLARAVVRERLGWVLQLWLPWAAITKVAVDVLEASISNEEEEEEEK